MREVPNRAARADLGAVVADAAQAGETLRAWSGESRAEFELLRRAANDWAERDLGGTNPHDLFAEAVAQLVANARDNRSPIAVMAGTP